MFEREFEFIVHHPLEVCEERILDMNKSGCFPPKLYRISSDVLSTKSEGYSEIYVETISNRGHHIAHIEAIIEEIDNSTSRISGSADARGFGSGIGLFIFIGLLWLFAAVVSQEEYIFFAGFSFLGAIFVALQAVHSRNNLITLLETTLTQPKKK